MTALKTLVIFLFLSQLAAESDIPAVDSEPIGRPSTRLSEIDLPPELLGGSWRRVAGPRIDNLNRLEDLPADQKQVAKALKKQLAPHRVIGVADYSLASKTLPLNTVTVRVFIFADDEKCEAWWTKKYGYPGWEQHYEPLDTESMNVLDSKQMAKRIYQFHNVWITAHQLGQGDKHKIAAVHVIRALTSTAKDNDGRW